MNKIKKIESHLKGNKQYLPFLVFLVLSFRTIVFLISLFFLSKTYRKIERKSIKIIRKIKKPRIVIKDKIVKIGIIYLYNIPYINIRIYSKDLLYIFIILVIFIVWWKI